MEFFERLFPRQRAISGGGGGALQIWALLNACILIDAHLVSYVHVRRERGPEVLRRCGSNEGKTKYGRSGMPRMVSHQSIAQQPRSSSLKTAGANRISFDRRLPRQVWCRSNARGSTTPEWRGVDDVEALLRIFRVVSIRLGTLPVGQWSFAFHI